MTTTSPLAASGLVALGGGAGAILRYQAGRALTGLLGPAAVATFPWATLFVNIAGSLAMGLLAGWLARHGSATGDTWRLLIGVGLLGGFTTFSAFSLEMMLLIVAKPISGRLRLNQRSSRTSSSSGPTVNCLTESRSP